MLHLEAVKNICHIICFLRPMDLKERSSYSTLRSGTTVLRWQLESSVVSEGRRVHHRGVYQFVSKIFDFSAKRPTLRHMCLFDFQALRKNASLIITKTRVNNSCQ